MFGGVSRLSIWLVAGAASAVPALATVDPPLPEAGSGSSTLAWDFEKAIVTGSGCRTDDVFMIAAGNDLTLVMSGMGVNLGDGYAPLAERASCSLRLPFRLGRGHHLESLMTRLEYGVMKSSGSSGEIAVRASALDAPASVLKVAFPHGQFLDEPLAMRHVINDYRADAARQCRLRAETSALFRLNLAIVASREGSDESIVIGSQDGQGIVVNASVRVGICSL